MKVVISTDLYYPMINGVAMFSRNLAAGLHKRGHDVLVLAPSLTGKFEIEKDAEFGFSVVRLSSFKMAFYPDQINKAPEAKEFLGIKIPRLFYKNGMHVSLTPYGEIKRVLDDFEPDIIHDQTPGPVAVAVFRYAKRRKIPIVATDHAFPDNLTQQLKIPRLAKKPLNQIMNQYFLSFLKRSEYATMPTEQAIADLLPKNRQKFKVKVEALSNGIDLSRFAPGKASREIYTRYDIPTGHPTALYVGRVDPEKSLDILIKAFAKVLDDLSEAQLVVVGDGTARGDLEELAKDLGIAKQVFFTGRVVGGDLPQLYRCGDAFAITSKTETQSIVLMEAMATGLPCIAVKAGAVPELVKHGKNGYIYAPDDIKSVARGLSRLLESSDLRKKMGQKSLELVKKHDISHTLTRIEEIYQGVLDAREQNHSA